MLIFCAVFSFCTSFDVQSLSNVCDTFQIPANWCSKFEQTRLKRFCTNHGPYIPWKGTPRKESRWPRWPVAEAVCGVRRARAATYYRRTTARAQAPLFRGAAMITHKSGSRRTPAARVAGATSANLRPPAARILLTAPQGLPDAHVTGNMPSYREHAHYKVQCSQDELARTGVAT